MITETNANRTRWILLTVGSVCMVFFGESHNFAIGLFSWLVGVLCLIMSQFFSEMVGELNAKEGIFNTIDGDE